MRNSGNNDMQCRCYNMMGAEDRKLLLIWSALIEKPVFIE